MKNVCFLLAISKCIFAHGQMQLDPWMHQLLNCPFAAWIEHTGPQPGLTQINAWGLYGRISGGISLNTLGPQAWAMSKVPIHGPINLAAGLGWNGQQPEILVRIRSGPWVVAALPLNTTWSATWRQRQTSGWVLTAHVEQNLIAMRTEWSLGVEGHQLALYASSIGRWRAVLTHGSVRIALGGGRTAWTSIGYAPLGP